MTTAGGSPVDGVRAQPAWAHARTARLLLDLPTAADGPELFRLHADPAVWTHFPSGVHTDPASGPAMVAASRRQFAEDGLGYWSVREAASGNAGPVVGRGGCAVPADAPWWNLYYRLSPAVQGRGYAREVGAAALEAAHAVEPGRPVMAFLLEHNLASRRTAEAIGLHLVWRGPDLGNPDPEAIRLVFLDREPSDELVARIDERFRPPVAG